MRLDSNSPLQPRVVGCNCVCVCQREALPRRPRPPCELLIKFHFLERPIMSLGNSEGAERPRKRQRADEGGNVGALIEIVERLLRQLKSSAPLEDSHRLEEWPH